MMIEASGPRAGEGAPCGIRSRLGLLRGNLRVVMLPALCRSSGTRCVPPLVERAVDEAGEEICRRARPRHGAKELFDGAAGGDEAPRDDTAIVAHHLLVPSGEGLLVEEFRPVLPHHAQILDELRVV